MPAVSPHLDARERDCVEEVLRTAEVAYVAMVESSDPHGTPRPYVVPMNFAYEPPARGSAASSGAAGLEGRLLLHTGPGRKARALAADPHVCVSVTSREQLDLGPTPCDDGYLYQSVLLEGQASLLTGDAEREAALRTIVAKYDPPAVTEAFKPQVFSKTLLYVVQVQTIGFKERPKHH